MSCIIKSTLGLLSKPLSSHLVKDSQRFVLLHTTRVLNKSHCAGRFSPTPKKDLPLTYEQANPPDMIGVRKGWNSINTSSLHESLRPAETSHEDLFIRKFIHGTWPRLLSSDVIIKRRGNQIYCSFMTVRGISPTKMYFLIGYTEEILSYILKCVVKLELQTINESTDMIYKFI